MHLAKDTRLNPINISFLTRKPLTLVSIDYLLEEGSGIGDSRKCFLPVSQADIHEELHPLRIQEFMQMRQARASPHREPSAAIRESSREERSSASSSLSHKPSQKLSQKPS
jgi:hypothetical protein